MCGNTSSCVGREVVCVRTQVACEGIEVVCVGTEVYRYKIQKSEFYCP